MTLKFNARRVLCYALTFDDWPGKRNVCDDMVRHRVSLLHRCQRVTDYGAIDIPTLMTFGQ